MKIVKYTADYSVHWRLDNEYCDKPDECHRRKGLLEEMQHPNGSYSDCGWIHGQSARAEIH
jgi:hypothetical protein